MKLNNLLLLQDLINNDKYNRYNSWQYCFDAFEDLNNNDDYLALHLGFYLASWGMYRGSAGLLQKDYKVHIGAVGHIKSFRHLRAVNGNEIENKDVGSVEQLANILKKYYGEIEYFNSKNEKHKITPTDTLISKILLGTLGCTPAFDNYFCAGVKVNELDFTTLDNSSLDNIWIFIEKHKTELLRLQNDFLTMYNLYYPLMKLVDMYFWNEGFENELKKLI